MQILIDMHPKASTTFADIEVSRLFVMSNMCYVKVNTTQAMPLDHQGELFSVSMHEEVQRVSRVAVTAHR